MAKKWILSRQRHSRLVILEAAHGIHVAAHVEFHPEIAWGFEMPSIGIAIFGRGTPEMRRDTQFHKFVGRLARRYHVEPVAVAAIPLVAGFGKTLPPKLL